ncbi:MAG: hypothetical protein V4469_04555 [Patescibacteria group bacterium]
MSSYKNETKHPETGKWEIADWIDDHFGSHKYGVVFPSKPDVFYNPEEIDLKTRKSKPRKEYIMIVPNKGKTIEIVLHKDKILEILKKYVATSGYEFLGLEYKERHQDNIDCLDEHQLLVPQEGVRFSAKEFPNVY